MATRSRTAETTSDDRLVASITDTSEDWLTTAQASEKTGVPRSTLRRWAQRHDIRTRVGDDGDRLLSVEDILSRDSRRRRDAMGDVSLVTVDQAHEMQDLLERAMKAERELRSAEDRYNFEKDRRSDFENRLATVERALEDERRSVGEARKRADELADAARKAQIEAAELRAEEKARAERKWWRRRR